MTEQYEHVIIPNVNVVPAALGKSWQTKQSASFHSS